MHNLDGACESLATSYECLDGEHMQHLASYTGGALLDVFFLTRQLLQLLKGIANMSVSSLAWKLLCGC